MSAEMDMVIPVIIPAYEPDQRLLVLMEKLTEKDISPVVIVDDGSGKEYQHLFQICADRYHAVVLRHDVNKGKGRALKTAFSYCMDHFDSLFGCITADSDGQHTPEAILACRESLIANPGSLILGVRDFSGDNVPKKSQFGNNLTRRVFRRLYKKDISDTQTGLRGIPCDYMKELVFLPGERFEYETRMLIDAVGGGIKLSKF